MMTGNDLEAERYCQDSFTLFQQLSSKGVMLTPANHLAQLALRRGDSVAAIHRYCYNLELALTVGRKDSIGRALAGIAASLSVEGNAEAAARLFGAVEALRTTTQMRPPPIEADLEEHHQSAVKAVLGAVRYAAAFEDGKRMNVFEVCRETLEQIASGSPHA